MFHKPIARLLILMMCLLGYPARAQDQLEIVTSVLAQSMCSGTFISHDLAFTTTTQNIPIRFFESNGAGLAINDFNDDGWLDIVFANLYGRNTILWNEGGLQFRAEALAEGNSRAVNAVDVDSDGQIDLVFSHSISAPTYWHNNAGSFQREPLNGVRKPAYSMTWADVDRDGDLDLAMGSYDADLEKQLGNTFLFSAGAGVFIYMQDAGSFTPTRLAERSQALALWLSDLDADGTMDLMVGNDFTMPDQAWSYQDENWQQTRPFAVTTLSTMSFDAGDLDNDGRTEFFAADMKPESSAPEIVSAWQPVIDQIARSPRLPDDNQMMTNMLQVPHRAGSYSNQAELAGIAATGWSWSAKFGDLDSDGYLDLYVVNGMIARDIFAHLPQAELVEANAAFHNQGGLNFVPAPEWGLGSLRSGRGMSMADLDNDGDLDIVVNNLGTPAQLFENQLCGGHNLLVDLRQPETGNTRALGARLSLQTSAGIYSRDVRASSGYLSGDPTVMHFGIPTNTAIERLEVVWPDGETSVIENPTADTHLTITRLN